MSGKKRNAGAAVGGSSLLVIFAVLCLVTFVVLALATVRADERQMADMTAAIEYYCQADNRAQLILAQLREGQVPAGVTEIEDGVYGWSVSIPNGLMLDCCVRAGPDGEYEILRWATMRETEWQGDFSLSVWTGE